MKKNSGTYQANKMKMTIRIITVFVCFAMVLPMLSSAQGPRKEKTKEKIHEMRKNFIVEGLTLSEEQSARFWPIYDSFQEELDALMRDFGPSFRDPSVLTDEAAELELAKMLAARERERKLHKAYFDKMRDILPARQILILHHRERLFNKKVFERVRERRGR